MTWRFSILLLAVSTLPALGDGPLLNRDCTKTTCPPSRYCCPDDYVAKPLPPACPSARGCGDDYCAKPLPPAAPSARGCVDDYCPKWFPKCLPPSLKPWYICSPPGCNASVAR
ncbi:MAG: hypothetical protein WCL32_18225 [Planctomycetota bacterium]